MFTNTNNEVGQVNVPVKPEWIRPNPATKIFGIGRTKLYELMAEGKIKTACLRKRGEARGTRLISYDSLSAYVESMVETPAEG